jgi:hypothetical protein
MTQRELQPTTEDHSRSIKVGTWMSQVAVVLVMIPSAYRLVNEPLHWGDAAMLLVGTGLVAFHIARLVRLHRVP